MKAFEFIYYCIYCVVLSIKDIQEKQEKLTAELYFIPLFFNFLMIFFPFVVISSLIKTIKIPFSFSAIIILLMFFGLNVFCKKYFIRKNNCERIIKLYQSKIKNRNAAILGVLYFVFSFAGFVISSEYSDKIREIWVM